MNALEYLIRKLNIDNDEITMNGKYYRIRKNINGFRYDISGTSKNEVLRKLIIEIEKNEIYTKKIMVMVGTMNHCNEISVDKKLKVVSANLNMLWACDYAKGNSQLFDESLDIFYVLIVDDSEIFKKMLNPILFVHGGVLYKHYPVILNGDYNIIDFYESTDFIGENCDLIRKKEETRKIERALYRVIDYEAFKKPEEMEQLINEFLMINQDDSMSYERYIPNGIHNIPDND